MLNEWLLIGLPVAFLLGWVAARLDIRHIRKNAAELPRAYLRGLAHLLAKEESKALDVFLEAPVTNAEPEEFLFAVAKLSRGRGEHERALRVHRQLYEREDLPVALRHRALWELALDYQSVGFLDYAEQHAKPLLDNQDYGKQAFNFLLAIYQRRRRYDLALEMIEKAGELLMRRKMAAQLYCQLSFAAADAAEEKRLLTRALEANPDCVRARLLLAEKALAAEDVEMARQCYAAVESQEPAYLWQAVAGMLRAETLAGQEARGRRELLRWLDDHPSPVLFRHVHDALATTTDGVGDLARRFLLKHGGATAAAYWAETHGGGDDGGVWMMLRDELRRATQKSFACESCGYEVDDFSWQCRGCWEWESLRQNSQRLPSGA